MSLFIGNYEWDDGKGDGTKFSELVFSMNGRFDDDTTLINNRV